MSRNKNYAGDEIFTPGEVDAAIEEVVAEAGETYIYPHWWTGCTYRVETIPTIPSCLVGRVVSKLDGFLFYDLQENTSFAEQPEEIRARFPDDCVEALQSAQWAQDRGWKWGNALKVYNKVRHEDLMFSPRLLTESELD